MQKLKSSEYDLVFLTNTPAFYKINLFNKLGKLKKILIIFQGYGNQTVNTALDDYHCNFDYFFLNYGDTNGRNKIYTTIKLLRLMNKIKTNKILFGGWDSIEYILYSFISPRRNNMIICESTIFESTLKGIKGFVKKHIINRMSVALPCGEPHKKIFEQIKFKGKILTTGSVGIFNKNNKKQKNIHTPLRYLFVGRLIDVKNIELLIKAFNINKKPLTIVGDGNLKGLLKSAANNNIKFLGFINNDELGAIFQDHDVLILPSYSETWGMVVEEAIYWGLPVIVSNAVGCSIDIVRNLETGEIFKSNNIESLLDKISIIEANYNKYKKNVDSVNFEERDKLQVKTFIEAIEI